MNLDPTLSNTDRIGSAVMGAVLVAIAIFGGFDKPSVQGGVAVLGLAFVIGGMAGT